MWGFVAEALWENGQLRHVVNSQQGVPQELVDHNGKLVWQGTFDDWGKLIDEKGSTTCRLRLPGQIADDETGLHYNRFRYYSPEAGQFVSADPIGFRGGTNEYRFGPNAVSWIDPLGLECGSDACKPTENTKVNALPEEIAPRPVKPQDAIGRWNAFLGPGEHTNVHPRTGRPDPHRIVSADGQRSIRYGEHEMGSKPTKHHYHEETWSYDSASDTITVTNTQVRVPLSNK